MTERPEDEVEQLQERSDELGDEISEAREDWQQKVADPNVPGTPPPSEAEDDQDERAPWPDE